MSHAIPDAALDDRHAFVGMTGSGKTYSAGTAVERILSRKGRVIIVDPLGVWWGLRLLADGRLSPFDVVIFGGQHGDMPINEHSGALIGEAVAGIAESCILDLSEFGTAASERRFMFAFLTSLYRHANNEPVHLIFDEADMWAPERIMDKEGDAMKLHGQMQTIVRRGRIKGFISWLITQRPAALSKNVLSQVDGLISFKLTATHDRKALGAWIEGQADRERGKEIMGSLAELQKGQAVVWIPGRGVLQTCQFPEKATFDSSRAPKRGEKPRTLLLGKLDLLALRERLSTVEAETKANDPKLLKAEIARLRSLQNHVVPDPKAIKVAFDKGYEAGRVTGVKQGRLAAAKHWLDSLRLVTDELEKTIQNIPESGLARLARPPAPSRNGQTVGAKPVARSLKGNGDDHEFTGQQRKILNSLTFWRSIDHEAPTREQVAAVAGYKAGSGNFNNILGTLRTMGAIEYPGSGLVSLQTSVGDLLEASEARAMMLSKLTGSQKKIVEAAKGHEKLTREEMAERTEFSAGSGNFNNLLGSLRTIGILTYPRSGEVALSDWAAELLA